MEYGLGMRLYPGNITIVQVVDCRDWFSCIDELWRSGIDHTLLYSECFSRLCVGCSSTLGSSVCSSGRWTANPGGCLLRHPQLHFLSMLCALPVQPEEKVCYI